MPSPHNHMHAHPARWLFRAPFFVLFISACRTAPGPVPTAALPTGTPANALPTPTATAQMDTATTAPPTSSPTPTEPTATTAPPSPEPTATEPAVTATLHPSRPVVQSAEAQQRWREDLQFLAERANVLHPDFTYLTSAQEFADLVAQIDAAIPYHTDNQIIVGFIRLVARSDGH